MLGVQIVECFIQLEFSPSKSLLHWRLFKPFQIARIFRKKLSFLSNLKAISKGNKLKLNSGKTE